jgi:hypothetical protein
MPSTDSSPPSSPTTGDAHIAAFGGQDMDGREFDEMARSLVTSGSRRAGLRALVSGALAVGVARLGLEEVAGAASGSCKQVGRKCEKDNDCCSKKCRRGKCRCLKAQAKCGASAGVNDGTASCCGSLVCGYNCDWEATEKLVCCRPVGEVGCNENCDCCKDFSVCRGGRCCVPLGAPCQDGQHEQCCEGKCVDWSCVP